mmetsp:Transcript_38936/g.102898  ORF Transcript_38936/g.102898 Transcript_38936/m.102898 type:complete len:309 (-) Transcript_38936:148-1074(-)
MLFSFSKVSTRYCPNSRAFGKISKPEAKTMSRLRSASGFHCARRGHLDGWRYPYSGMPSTTLRVTSAGRSLGHVTTLVSLNIRSKFSSVNGASVGSWLRILIREMWRSCWRQPSKLFFASHAKRSSSTCHLLALITRTTSGCSAQAVGVNTDAASWSSTKTSDWRRLDLRGPPRRRSQDAGSLGSFALVGSASDPKDPSMEDDLLDPTTAKGWQKRMSASALELVGMSAMPSLIRRMAVASTAAFTNEKNSIQAVRFAPGPHSSSASSVTKKVRLEDGLWEARPEPLPWECCSMLRPHSASVLSRGKP